MAAQRDSHVEMDGAWALYEAWLRLQLGDIDIACAMGSGRSSTADPSLSYQMEMDPFYLAPLGADAVSFAALQARILLESDKVTERQMAEIAARCRRDAKRNQRAQVVGDFDVDDLLLEDYVRAPLRRHDLPRSRTAPARWLSQGRTRRRNFVSALSGSRIARYSELHYPGMRDCVPRPLPPLPHRGPASLRRRLRRPIQAAFTHEEPLLVEALGLLPGTKINPSGGPLAANPIMATGLVRIAEAAGQIRDEGKRRTLGHATSGPCLQQNLVCVLEGS